MPWRLGIDLGTNSLGWWAYEVQLDGNREKGVWRAVASKDGGVLIFSDGREPGKGGRVGDSRAVARRMARGMRRNRDRGRNRKTGLINKLISLNLLPADEKERRELFQTPPKPSPGTSASADPYNPYRLRSEALERTLTPHELGRALAHLGLRRGFKSNRKDASDEDGGKLKERIEQLRDQLGGVTLGQYLWQSYQTTGEREKAGELRPGIRFRADKDVYPDRAMVADELSAIRDWQKRHHNLSDIDWDSLRDNFILHQWPLKAVERGACEFYHDQPRHWKDTPIGHDFRIYQELNNLKWIDADRTAHGLDRDQRQAVIEFLLTYASEVKFKAIGNAKGKTGERLFPKNVTFNLDDDKRKGLKPHSIAQRLRKEPALVPLWEARQSEAGDNGRLDEAFTVLHEAADDNEARERLAGECSLDAAAINALVGLKLGTGTANVSRQFMEAIVPVLRDQGLVYSDAVAELRDSEGNPLHHSLRDDGHTWPLLPYYGEVITGSTLGVNVNADPKNNPEQRFGRINNPTVHVALNQLRRLVNSLTERFGEAPIEVHVELTRDLKLPRRKRDEITAEQGRLQRENKRIKDICAEHDILDPSALDIKKVKLWEELGKNQLARQCVFSGKPISAAQLFNGEAEIEHLLPFSRTLDDGMANLTVAMRWANRLKGKYTPHEAFEGGLHAERGILWNEVLQRSEGLPSNKRWRFGQDAMERYERDGGFIARQLTDTAYMARVATRYLKALAGVKHVVASPGRLTAMVRGKWGLNGILGDDNKKSRDDHRHHAVDAAVIGLVDRGVLNQVSRLTARGADDRVYLAVPPLPDDLHQAIRERVPTIIVAHKPDHGVLGKMYKETAYGFIASDQRAPDFPDHDLVARMALVNLKGGQCEAIRDPRLRDRVLATIAPARDTSGKWDKAAVTKLLKEFVAETGVRRVRVLVKDQTAKEVASAPYKRYPPAAYVCCDIWRIPKGSRGCWRKGEFTWEGVYWSYADTIGTAPNPPDANSRKPHPAARFVTRLFKDDMVTYKDGGETVIARVARFSTTDNRLDLVSHAVANPKQNYISINVLLRARGLRRIASTFSFCAVYTSARTVASAIADKDKFDDRRHRRDRRGGASSLGPSGLPEDQ